MSRVIQFFKSGQSAGTR